MGLPSPTSEEESLVFLLTIFTACLQLRVSIGRIPWMTERLGINESMRINWVSPYQNPGAARIQKA